MYTDIAHAINEFADFPWERLDDEWFSSCGGVSRGGIIAGVDFNPSEPHLDFVDKDANRDAWAIPPQLGKLLHKREARGRDALRHELRVLLGVPHSRCYSSEQAARDAAGGK